MSIQVGLEVGSRFEKLPLAVKKSGSNPGPGRGRERMSLLPSHLNPWDRVEDG